MKASLAVFFNAKKPGYCKRNNRAHPTSSIDPTPFLREGAAARGSFDECSRNSSKRSGIIAGDLGKVKLFLKIGGGFSLPLHELAAQSQEDALFQTGDVALGDAEAVGYLLLGGFGSAAETKAEGDDVALALA